MSSGHQTEGNPQSFYRTMSLAGIFSNDDGYFFCHNERLKKSVR